LNPNTKYSLKITILKSNGMKPIGNLDFVGTECQVPAKRFKIYLINRPMLLVIQGILEQGKFLSNPKRRMAGQTS